MRLRVIAFLPAAGLIAFVFLISASSFVSAVERSLRFDSDFVPSTIRIERYETDCDVLHREIRVLSQAATSCDEEPSCLGSPLLCPITMNLATAQEYRRLRSAISERCGVSPGSMNSTRSVLVGAAATCGRSYPAPRLEASEEAEPDRFFF